MQAPMTAWQNFYVIAGTAAATLTGLMFVAITLVVGSQLRGSGEGLGAFSTPTVVHFGATLIIATLLSAPWPALWQASLLLGLIGIAGLGYELVVVRRTRRQTSYQPVLDDWLWHCIVPLATYTALLIAAFLLPRRPAPTLFGVGAAIVLLLVIGIHNAWDVVTYIAVGHVPPEDAKPDQGRSN